MKDDNFLREMTGRHMGQPMGHPGDAQTNPPRIHRATFDAGAMVRLGARNILMSPPLVISEAEIDAILAALDAGFSAV